MKFFAIQVLQDLIRFHLNDKDPEALVDVDLKRLLFVKANYTLPTKHELYLNAVQHLEQRVITSPGIYTGNLYEGASLPGKCLHVQAPPVRGSQMGFEKGL